LKCKKYAENSERESPLLKRDEESILLIIKTVLDILSEALYKQNFKSGDVWLLLMLLQLGPRRNHTSIYTEKF